MATTINPNQLVRQLQISRKRKATDTQPSQPIKRTPDKSVSTFQKPATKIPSHFSFAPIHSEFPAQRLVPLDWGVKEHVRVTSRDPTSWATTMSSTQVSAGTRSFVSGASRDGASPQHIKSQFRDCLLTWVHPALPCLASIQRPQLPEALVEELKQDWQTALSSAYQHLSATECSYFYLLGSSLAVLFTAGCALITGISDKLGAALRREGIYIKEGGTADGKSVAFEEAGDWLKGFGISSKEISLTPNRGKQESAAVLTTTDLQGLINFLLNHEPICSSGIPALLSPYPFEGATLRAARYKSGTSEEDGEKIRFVDISGIMLPSNMLRLHSLLRQEHSEYALKTRSQSVSDNLAGAMRTGSVDLIGGAADNCCIHTHTVKSVAYRNSLYHM